MFVFDFALLWALHFVLPALAAVSVAYLSAVGLHFCLNKWWVFEAGRTPVGSQVLRYMVTVALCWLVTVAVVGLALHTITTQVLAAKALAVPPATALAFLLLRFFVFRQPPQQESS